MYNINNKNNIIMKNNKQYVATFESFRSKLLSNLNENVINEAEAKELKPVQSSLAYLLSVVPFKDFKSFSEFLLSLTGKDFKALCGNTNPAKLLADYLAWTNIGANEINSNYGTVVYVGELTGTYRDKVNIDFSNKNMIVPFIYKSNDPIKDSESVADYNMSVSSLGTGGASYDLGINNGNFDGTTMREYISGKNIGAKINTAFDKKSEELYKNAKDTLAKLGKKFDPKELEKAGYKLNSFNDLASVLNKLSDKPKQILVDNGILEKVQGKLMGYSEEAKKAIKSTLGDKIAAKPENTDSKA